MKHTLWNTPCSLYLCPEARLSQCVWHAVSHWRHRGKGVGGVLLQGRSQSLALEATWTWRTAARRGRDRALGHCNTAPHHLHLVAQHGKVSRSRTPQARFLTLGKISSYLGRDTLSSSRQGWISMSQILSPNVYIQSTPDVTPESVGFSSYYLSLHSLKLRSLENPTPPYTPRSRRRWVQASCPHHVMSVSPNICAVVQINKECWLPFHMKDFPASKVAHLPPSVFKFIGPSHLPVILCQRMWLCRSIESPLALLPDCVALEEEACEGQNWQDTVSPQLLAMLSPKEVDRQAVIYGTSREKQKDTKEWWFLDVGVAHFISLWSELFTTEVSHLRTLRVLDQVFFQKMRSVLNSAELACIFPNLHQVYELHGKNVFVF